MLANKCKYNKNNFNYVSYIINIFKTKYTYIFYTYLKLLIFYLYGFSLNFNIIIDYNYILFITPSIKY